ncbi:LamG-like jellyroll fold domain-containing protein [Flammeovirga kamogawensis]|uniref:InlB B-repeat-containing protein n=1 Tax=Flammeovirga kamogawensis TaxID=373891 RepID=A0ABX8H0Q0_9BACT|nr:LamG-like jellyroll fold domain-containing protein [Flammeovirga kamogawensis]MBB6463645.1 putative repeat protein (TIGR02543 family) [Flammeovirga kamogawensis]QWG09259.1 InlB B-repeat-containing protein [Flammeovirga kamogawensis]TRX64783.1 T9SS type A sorting domain-containing protein [Flammeovirga kamogawensis]
MNYINELCHDFLYNRLLWLSWILIFIHVDTKAQQLNKIDEDNLSIGLRGYFSFDNTNCNYGIGENLVGTLKGSAVITPDAKYSQGALKVENTTGSYISFDDNNSLPFLLNDALELTIALWVKPQKAEGTNQNIIRVEGGGLTYQLEIANDNNFNSFISTVNPNQSNDFGNAFARSRGHTLSSENLNEWYHVAFTYDGTSTKIYINGELNHTENVNTLGYVVVPWTHRLLYLGGLNDASRQFTGTLDELYIYDRALTLEEIVTIKNLDQPLQEETIPTDFNRNIDQYGLADSLRGYFSFNENICDYGLGENLKATLFGNAQLVTDAKFSTNAISFSENSYAVFEEDNSVPFILNNEKEMSVAFWVKPEKADNTNQHILKVEKGGITYRVEIASDNNFNSYLSTVNPNQPNDFSNAYARATGYNLGNQSLNEWYHIALTFDGDSTRIFINGEINKTVNITKKDYVIVNWDHRLLYLGGQEDGENQFEGLLDELYIYNRTLKKEEVNLLMDFAAPLDRFYETYTVSFNFNYDNKINTYSASIDNNYNINIPISTRIGYDFLGWNTEEDGSGSYLTNDVLDVQDDITYYAQWSIINYDITYENNTEINFDNLPTSFTILDLPLLITPPNQEAKRFKYWYIDEELTQRLANNSIESLEDKTLFTSWIAIKEGVPTYTDYCEMLSRDINKEHYGFIAGNKMYYVAGAGQAEYENITELETIGFTHPMFRDGRARGQGIVAASGGVGHDQWGWEFWRHTKVAYGTIIIDGQRYEHPTPVLLDWRPDKMVAKYEVAGVKIKEEKFISDNDVLSTIISADQSIKIEFEGESFYDTRDIPTSDGDPAGVVRSQNCTSTVTYNEETNTVVLLENGQSMTKPNWGDPAIVGDMMYSGLHFVFSSTQTIYDFDSYTLEAGNIGYKFSIDVPAYEKVPLSLGVDDDELNAINRISADMQNIELARDEKTEFMNQLLNEEIPYFRCSDNNVVNSYYFLWSLYFMYFTDIDNGWEQYPHTQTAVNNFMGLHLWDSWAFCAAGSYVADKWKWGNGNALSWKFMVPYKNENHYLPDNFGTTWYSPETRMDFDGAVGQIWKQFDHSGDLVFLNEAYYELLRPLYIDNNSKAVGVNEAQELGWMAKELNNQADVDYWQGIEETQRDHYVNHSWPWLLRQYENDSWKNIWHVAELRNNALSPEMTDDYIQNFVVNTDRGFVSPMGLNTRSADSPPNGIFRSSTISTWLGIDGLFKQEAAHAGIVATLNHLNAMTREYGYPVAPEAWDHKDEAWGSRYYNWDIAMVMPLIEWIGGTNYSFVDSSFTYAPHLPDSWEFVEMSVPVVIENETQWVETKVYRTEEGEEHKLHYSVQNNPFAATKIKPYDENRTILGIDSEVKGEVNERGDTTYTKAATSLNVNVYLGNKIDSLETLVWTKPRSRIFYNEVNITAENLIFGTTIRYTTDGTIPTESSPIFSDSLKITNTTTFTFKAFGHDTYYKPYTITYENNELEPEVITNNQLLNQLDYEVYHLDENIKSLPNFDTLSVISKGEIQASDFVWDLDFAAVGQFEQEHFGLHLYGFIKIPEDEIYEFQLRSDDGSILQIDHQEVVYLNGVSDKDPWIAEGSIGLEKGLHYLDIYYTQYAYRQKLELQYRVLGEFDYKSVTSDMFYKLAPSCINFETNGGNEINAVCGLPGETIPSIAIPVKEGYTFDGWYSDATYQAQVPYQLTIDDINLFAKWKMNVYNSTYYYINNETVFDSGSLQYTIEDLPILLEEPVVEGKNFENWYNDINRQNSLESAAITSLKDSILYANFISTLSVTYFVEEEEYYQINSFLEDNIRVVHPEAPSLENKIFVGWFPRRNKEGIKIQNDITIDSNLNVYAGWFDLLPTSNATFISDDIVIYPNPLNNERLLSLLLENYINQLVQIEILDNKGKQLYKKNVFVDRKLVHIDLKKFPTGFYYLHITNNNQVISSQKLIIN